MGVVVVFQISSQSRVQIVVRVVPQNIASDSACEFKDKDNAQEDGKL